MAGGYFTDGTINVELGAHVFTTPGLVRRNVILPPPGAPAVVLPSGGGIFELGVIGQRVREDLGDAERYIYELFRALATSEPGELGMEDYLDRRAVFDDSVCVSASGEVRAFRFADMQFAFQSPEKSSEPAWSGAPLSPSRYVGSSTLQDYAAGGVTLGQAGGMTIEMIRAQDLREVPRARGARTDTVESEAQMRLTVRAAHVADTNHLARELEDLARQIGPGEVDLTANGHVYYGCVLDAIRPDRTDWRHTMFEAEFVQEVSNGAGQETTTTEAPTTTTMAI